jgi:hypothetical protein
MVEVLMTMKTTLTQEPRVTALTPASRVVGPTLPPTPTLIQAREVA